MIKQLVKLANDLDSKGFTKEADALDGVINKISQINPTSPYNTLAGPTRVDGVIPPQGTLSGRTVPFGQPGPSLPGPTTIRDPVLTNPNLNSPLTSEIGERAGRSTLRGAGGRLAAKKLLGRALVPLGFAMDIISIGVAGYEGVSAFNEISEAYQNISRDIVKSAIGDALISTLGELERDGWYEEGPQGLVEMRRAQLQWRRGGSLDARMKDAFRSLVSIATQVKAWGRHPVDTYIGTASTGPYSEYLDVDATRELYRHLIGRLTLTEDTPNA